MCIYENGSMRIRKTGTHAVCSADIATSSFICLFISLMSENSLKKQKTTGINWLKIVSSMAMHKRKSCRFEGMSNFLYNVDVSIIKCLVDMYFEKVYQLVFSVFNTCHCNIMSLSFVSYTDEGNNLITWLLYASLINKQTLNHFVD